MKISQLAAYRELLQDLRPVEVHRVLRAEIDPVIDTVSKHDMQMPQSLAALEQFKNDAAKSLRDFDHQLDLMLKDLLDQIELQEPRYLQASYQLYEQSLVDDSIDYILNRRLAISDSAIDYIRSRIQAHSDYHYSGLLIRPGLEDYIEQMVACDPLYVVDTDHRLFDACKARFNQIYQNRLRYYAIRESSQEPMMAILPDQQFGFCMAYNFFHYKPFEIMRAYLREIYSKLRPGGVLAFTFNDCDRRGAVELVERSFCCYTPGRLVLGICESVGFVVEKNYRLDAAADWVELRKPGQTVSLRGGQTLAKIVAKSK